MNTKSKRQRSRKVASFYHTGNTNLQHLGVYDSELRKQVGGFDSYRATTGEFTFQQPVFTNTL